MKSYQHDNSSWDGFKVKTLIYTLIILVLMVIGGTLLFLGCKCKKLVQSISKKFERSLMTVGNKEIIEPEHIELQTLDTQHFPKTSMDEKHGSIVLNTSKPKRKNSFMNILCPGELM
jgi:hypothetical protein